MLLAAPDVAKLFRAQLQLLGPLNVVPRKITAAGDTGRSDSLPVNLSSAKQYSRQASLVTMRPQQPLNSSDGRQQLAIYGPKPWRLLQAAGAGTCPYPHSHPHGGACQCNLGFGHVHTDKGDACISLCAPHSYYCDGSCCCDTGYSVFAGSCQQNVNASASEILVLRNSLVGGGVFRDYWPQNSNPCGGVGWVGVVCDARGHISDIKFSSESRTFTLGPAIGSLAYLTRLMLGGSTGLTGTVPPEICELRQLQWLDFSETTISGVIPNRLGQLGMLTRLLLSQTRLSGTLPVSVGNMSRLQDLDLQVTSMSGTLPTGLATLPNLEGFSIIWTSVSGTLPSQFAEHAKLIKMGLSNTKLSGTLAQEHFIQSLIKVEVASTKLSGTIPLDLIQSSTAAYGIELQNTAISGTLPPTFCTRCACNSFDMSSTFLSGTLPLSLGNWTSLSYFHLDSTGLSGSLPISISALHRLEHLILPFNQLSGSLPAATGQLDGLTNLDLHGNLIGASIPASLANCTNLQLLDLSNNSFTSLPELLPQPELTHLFLSGNPLNVTTDATTRLLSSLRSLREFDVSLNRLPIVLDCMGTQYPICLTNGCSGVGARVSNPGTCSLGPDASECKFILQMYDSMDRPVHTGGSLFNMTLRYNNHSTPMLDRRDGRFTAIIPTGWVQVQGFHKFDFFYGDKEFFPVMTTTGIYGSDQDCGRYCSYPSGGGCTSLRTVLFEPRECTSNAEPDSTGTICQCQPGFVPDTGTESTNPSCHRLCGPRKRPSDIDSRKCDCVDGTYDTSANGIVLCSASSWVPPESFSEYAAAQSDIAAGQKCSPCPTLCTNCSMGMVTLRQGWRINTEPTALRPAIWAVQVAVRCPYDGSECPRLVLSPGTETATEVCSNNHTGRMCALCQAGFSAQSSKHNMCQPCASLHATTDWIVVVALLAIALCLVCWQWTRLKWAKAAVNTNLKIMLGSMQVLSLISGVLRLVYPTEARASLNAAAIPSLSLRTLFSLDCWGWSWYDRWLVVTVVLPGVAFLVVVVSLAVQRRARGPSGATRKNGIRRLFYVALFLYPQVSTTILSALQCRQIGSEISVLEADYAVLCSDSQYELCRYGAQLLVLLWVLGIPFGLLAVMWREWSSNQSDYANMVSTFEFCASDYRPGCFWFEPVDMLRKLALSGLLQFSAPGTAAQVFFGCAIAFSSFGLQLYLVPYREPEANKLKLLVDAQIFFTFLLSFILRVLPSLPFEPLQPQFYASVLSLSVLILVVLAATLTLRMIRRQGGTASRGTMHLALDASSNPADIDSGVAESELIEMPRFTVEEWLQNAASNE
jgi:Leucine-rich repeat (LRR) protein